MLIQFYKKIQLDTIMNKEDDDELDTADKREDDWWRLEKSQVGRRKFC